MQSLAIALLLLACPRPSEDTDATVGPGDSPPDSPPEDTDVVDVDEDGFPDGTDCDDYDPTVYPGAEETWNNTDDDCDGFVDGDGSYSGSVPMAFSAVVEGQSIAFSLDCPAELTRAGSNFTFLVTCAPDPGDDQAVLLVGDTLWVEEVENVASGGTWTGSVIATSSDGWDTTGTGELSWTSFQRTALGVRIDAFSLRMSGTGQLAK